MCLTHWQSYLVPLVIFFSVFTIYRRHYSTAIKLTLAPISIKTLSLFPSRFILITGILSFLSSSAEIFRCSLFVVVVHLGFLTVRLSLTPQEEILDAKVMIVGLKLFLPLKAEATGCCMELALGIAICAMASWSIANFQQPNNPFSHRHSKFPGKRLQPHYPGP